MRGKGGAGHQRQGPGRRKSRVVTTAGPAEREEGCPARAEAGAARSPDSGRREGGRPAARRPGGQSKGVRQGPGPLRDGALTGTGASGSAS